MENCDQIDIIGYMEGIDPDGQTARHIAACPKCRQQLRKYEFVMKILAETGQTGCPKKKDLLLDALEEGGAVSPHLAECPECRQAVARLKAEIQAVGQRPLQEMAPLPPALNAKVAELRQQHQRRQVERVLDLQGIKDQRSREDAMRRMMEAVPEDLPKAAFPDDLADDEDDDNDR